MRGRDTHIQEDFLKKEPREISLEGLVGFQYPGCPKIIFKNIDSSWKNYQRIKHRAQFNEKSALECERNFLKLAISERSQLLVT